MFQRTRYIPPPKVQAKKSCRITSPVFSDSGFVFDSIKLLVLRLFTDPSDRLSILIGDVQVALRRKRTSFHAFAAVMVVGVSVDQRAGIGLIDDQLPSPWKIKSVPAVLDARRRWEAG